MLRQYVNLPRSIHILCLGSFINRAGTFVVIFLTLYLKTKLDLGVKFATTTMGLFGVGAIAAALIGGQLADQVGRRTVMLTALFGGAAILVVFSFVTAPWLIVLMVVAFALVAEMYRPAASAMIADLTSPGQRPHAFGLMYVAVNLGFTVGAFVGGIIAKYDFHWLFWGDAFTSAVFGLIILTALRETLPGHRTTTPPPAGSYDEPTTGERPAEPHLPVDPAREVEAQAPLLAAARHIITNTTFVVFCFGTFLIALVFMQSLSTFPLYLEDRGFTADNYGSIIALNGLLIVVLQLPLTSLLGRFDRGSVMTVGAICNAIGFGLIGLATTLWQFALTIVVWTVGEIMMAPYGPAIVSDLAPTRLRARYMGVFTMSFSSALVFAAPLGGAVLAHPKLGGRCLWSAAFVVAMIAALLYFSIRRRITGSQN
jgi:MFS family permease